MSVVIGPCAAGRACDGPRECLRLVRASLHARYFYEDFTGLDRGLLANYRVGGDALSALAWFDVSFVESQLRSEGSFDSPIMLSHILDDVQHWRGRAEASRVLAEQMSDAIAREMMLRIASNYERIAEQAIARADTRQA